MSDDSQDPELDDSLNTILSSMQAEIKTNMPGKVLSYDKAKQWAVIQPLFNRTFLNENDEEYQESYAPINNVPIQFPRFGDMVITFPVPEGSQVWLNFSERALDSFLSSDGKTIIDPISGRMHDINDAIATPKFSTAQSAISNVSDTDLVIRNEEGTVEIHVTPSKEVQIKADKVCLGSLTANKALALAEKTENRLSAIETNISTHVHPVIAPGTPTGPNTTPIIGPQPSVASTKVFTDA